MAPLRTVLFSGVRHAASYLPLLLSNPRVQVLGVCEEDSAPDWAREDSLQLCQALGVPFLGDPSQTLTRHDIQLVVVCSEPSRHARLAIMALESNRHVLVDKPFATNLDDATRVLMAAKASSGRCSVINRLYGPPVQRARQHIDAGYLGLVLSLDLEFLADGTRFSSSVERPELVVNPALSGGGELANFLVYPVDYLRYLSGAEVREVYAEAGTFFFEPHRQNGVEDLGVLSLKLDHDINATLTVGRVPRAPSASPITSSMRIIGSHGHLTVEEDEPHLEVWSTATEKRFQPAGAESGEVAVKAVIDHFVQDIVQNRVPLYGPEDAWATIAVIDASYRSVAAGQPVPVAPNPFRRIKA